MKTELSQAIQTLSNALKSDADYYNGWQSNIAMAFYDECIAQGSKMDKSALHKICNDAAIRFLNNFLHDAKTKPHE